MRSPLWCGGRTAPTSPDRCSTARFSPAPSSPYLCICIDIDTYILICIRTSYNKRMFAHLSGVVARHLPLVQTAVAPLDLAQRRRDDMHAHVSIYISG